ncbi:YraN family protein [Bifidobacterium samirii]|uniref:UPF0102 protein D2E24_1580 n=1 Tax=Bifidobacterium samirii TaxID=2306974 RepID=A0A430FNR3_9BIFI|nr:YraN family protein [Bifidobacterium samirii]RSX54459.1 endonuclease [Bifidobacterium samirii]
MDTYFSTIPPAERTALGGTGRIDGLDASDASDPDPEALAARLSDVSLPPRELGALGERYAAAWLAASGFTVLERNWRCRYGELDIVALSPERSLVFVEVKTRRGVRYGPPQEAVTARKRNSLRAAAVQWLTDSRHRVPHRGVRFDVIAIVAAAGAPPVLRHIREVC